MSTSSKFSVPQDDLDKLGTMWSDFLSKIDHDFVTPLVTMRMIADTLSEYLPDLIKAYQLAVDKQLVEPLLDKRRMQYFTKTPESVIHCVEKLSDLLQWLRPIYGDLLSDSTKAESINSADFIEQFTSQPVFSSQQQELMAINQQTAFSFRLHRFFYDALLSCLSETAVECWKGENGKLEIRTDSDANNNHIELKIHFAGEAGERLPDKRMRHFFFKTAEGEIVQLPFCKLALMQLGGDIDYQFKPNESLCFHLKFPKT